MAIIMPYKSAAPKIDESVFLAPTAVVAGDVTIEEGVSVWFGAVVRGDFQPIKIGKNTNIQENATIHVMHDHPTTIGEGVIIGADVMVKPFVEQGLLALQHDDVQAYFLRLQQYLLAEGGGLCIQCICLESVHLPSGGVTRGEVEALRDDHFAACLVTVLGVPKVGV